MGNPHANKLESKRMLRNDNYRHWLTNSLDTERVYVEIQTRHFEELVVQRWALIGNRFVNHVFGAVPRDSADCSLSVSISTKWLINSRMENRTCFLSSRERAWSAQFLYWKCFTRFNFYGWINFLNRWQWSQKGERKVFEVGLMFWTKDLQPWNISYRLWGWQWT